MAQTNNRILDEIARLMNDAAGVAQGVRREFDTVFRAQAERVLRDPTSSSARNSRPSRRWPAGARGKRRPQGSDRGPRLAGRRWRFECHPPPPVPPTMM